MYKGKLIRSIGNLNCKEYKMKVDRGKEKEYTIINNDLTDTQVQNIVNILVESVLKQKFTDID